MKGIKFLQVITLLLCAGMLYFSYETYTEARQIHEESQAMFAKADSILSIPAAKSVAKSVSSTGSKAANLLDEIFTDLENEYHASKKEAAKSAPRIKVSSSYRIEDRYVPYKVYDPETLGNEEGTIIIDIQVDCVGKVKKTTISPATTITDEEVLDAARKAALRTDFNTNFDAQETQSGTIIYTLEKR